MITYLLIKDEEVVKKRVLEAVSKVIKETCRGQRKLENEDKQQGV